MLRPRQLGLASKPKAAAGVAAGGDAEFFCRFSSLLLPPLPPPPSSTHVIQKCINIQVPFHARRGAALGGDGGADGAAGRAGVGAAELRHAALLVWRSGLRCRGGEGLAERQGLWSLGLASASSLCRRSGLSPIAAVAFTGKARCAGPPKARTASAGTLRAPERASMSGAAPAVVAHLCWAWRTRLARSWARLGGSTAPISLRRGLLVAPLAHCL